MAFFYLLFCISKFLRYDNILLEIFKYNKFICAVDIKRFNTLLLANNGKKIRFANTMFPELFFMGKFLNWDNILSGVFKYSQAKWTANFHSFLANNSKHIRFANAAFSNLFFICKFLILLKCVYSLRLKIRI